MLTQNYSSDATPLETGSSGSVFFELGIFQDPVTGAEFVPTIENAEDWEMNWVSFTPASGSDTPGESLYNDAVSSRATVLGQNTFGDVVELGSDTNEVASFASPADPSSELTVGRQVYIWGFNDQTYDPNAASSPEWILFTGAEGGSESSDTNWLVPDSTAAGNDSFTFVWDVFNADTAVVGRIFDSDGEGEIDDVVFEGFDDIQLATIPEPSSLLCILTGAIALLLRRRA